MVDERTLRKYINTLDHIRHYFQELLEEEIKLGVKPANRGEYLKEFTQLKDIIASGAWPKAVPEDALVETRADKRSRAKTILEEYIVDEIKDSRFLDYGCGDGFVVDLAAQTAKVAVGFNEKEKAGWENRKGVLTTNQHNIELLSPFDIILLYDVLDHCDNPVPLLTRLKKALNKEGSIYVRCHPWPSRHATHSYRKSNLAYIHMVCTEEELIKLGIESKKTHKLINPEAKYRSWFEKAGLEIVSVERTNQPVEEFFTRRPLIARRLAENFWNVNKGVPLKRMEIQFIDYVLTVS
jgi:2-polyprenyl-3-methyl-5-hydroxy-6-metoxy-1,4-benzoquinol methylase